MKLVDYTGKINSHDEYLEILKKLEKKSQYIEYVLVDETDTKFIEKFTSLIVSMTSKNKWWGTKTGGRGRQVYKIKSSKDIFSYSLGADNFANLASVLKLYFCNFLYSFTCESISHKSCTAVFLISR